MMWNPGSSGATRSLTLGAMALSFALVACTDEDSTFGGQGVLTGGSAVGATDGGATVGATAGATVGTTGATAGTTGATAGTTVDTGGTTGTTGATAGTTGATAGTTAGTTGDIGGTTVATGGATGATAGTTVDTGGATGDTTGDTGDTTGDTGNTSGGGECCSDGDCLCHGDAPSELTSDDGPYGTDSYSLRGTGCIYYPTDAEPPFAAVAVSDGFLGSGGCGSFQTGGWGDFLASWGIVTMIIETTGVDQPPTRGDKLLEGIQGFKDENENSSSPLFEKLSGRYGTSGFSMGGGGTSYATVDDTTLLSSVALMAWGPSNDADSIQTPTLVTCGSRDSTASCRSHGNGLYADIPDSTPKMRIEFSSGHAGQPSSGGGVQGAYGLAWHKAFLEGDERWLTLLEGADSEEDNL